MGNKQSMAIQIGENVMMYIEINVQNKVIKEEEIKKLDDGIRYLKDVNEEKENKQENILKGNEQTNPSFKNWRMRS